MLTRDEVDQALRGGKRELVCMLGRLWRELEHTRSLISGDALFPTMHLRHVTERRENGLEVRTRTFVEQKWTNVAGVVDWRPLIRMVREKKGDGEIDEWGSLGGLNEDFWK